jgi:hypothetical protein
MLLLSTMLGWLVRFLPVATTFGTQAAITEVVVGFLRLMAFAGPVLLVLAVVAIRSVPPRWLPGVRGHLAAAALRRYSSALEAGLTEAAAMALVDPLAPDSILDSKVVGLDRVEAKLGRRMQLLDGSRLAARVLATELELEAEESSRRFRTWAPITGFGLLAIFGVPVVVALYLPIFSIAGSIK